MPTPGRALRLLCGPLHFSDSCSDGGGGDGSPEAEGPQEPGDDGGHLTVGMERAVAGPWGAWDMSASGFDADSWTLEAADTMEIR